MTTPDKVKFPDGSSYCSPSMTYVCRFIETLFQYAGTLLQYPDTASFTACLKSTDISESKWKSLLKHKHWFSLGNELNSVLLQQIFPKSSRCWHSALYKHFYYCYVTSFSWHRKYLLSQVTCSVRRVENFVEEDGIVKCKTKSYRMCRLHLIFGDVQSRLVRLLWLANDTCNKTHSALAYGCPSKYPHLVFVCLLGV